VGQKVQKRFFHRVILRRKINRVPPSRKFTPTAFANSPPQPAPSAEIGPPLRAGEKPRQFYGGRPISEPPIHAEQEPSGVQKAIFFLLCVYLASNLANDWAMRIFGSKAFLSLITGVLLPIACLLGGVAFRGLALPTGRFWLAFLVWTILSLPFSTWRGGSFAMTQEFLTKNAPIYFYITASVVNIALCRKLFYVTIFGGFLVVCACFFFGDASSGRLLIPNSLFFDNANDLALQLLISAMLTSFLILSGGKFGKLVGAVLLGAALLFTFRTASRANFLSLCVCATAAFILYRNRARMLLLGAVMAILAAVVIPPEQWTRMVFIVVNPTGDGTVDGKENGDLQSQLERTDLFKRSLVETMTHPIFGLGAGQFGTVLWAEAKAKGQHNSGLGTHNTYTQVSSELGVPALVLYLVVLVGCLKMNRSLYRQSSAYPELKDVSNMAFCLFLALLAYSCSTFFHHVAFSRQLPTLAGMSAALWMAGTRKIQEIQARGSAPPVQPVMARMPRGPRPVALSRNSGFLDREGRILDPIRLSPGRSPGNNGPIG
jgi:O-antigen ligase